ncbi:MAG TPA: rRNA pseudouridine synthase [Nitrospirae bacterium]|nr:ribosomal large subunit pseudouridine synthase B [bacterium BMS3Abin06]HDH11344.1 rRNA pseudouridine synthase [Nitrospirota bacterium]HDZ00080.1 rRNA pseudouridine synthase [Nitrospirota bacterium]
MEERLQKIIARCGIASRRKAEEMILEGLVRVNGKPATIGMKADLERDHIKVKGKLISRAESKVYMAFNKPVNCLTASHDAEGRPTVKDFLKRVKARVFPVGRLDFNSEGLLILTNDGDLANAILHPKKKIPKTYRVKIDGFLEDKDVLRLEKGIKLEDGVTAPAKVRKIKRAKANSWIEITIYEGRKRQIRRMLERVNHPVIKLVRTGINGLELGSLKPGEYRYLTPGEIERLKIETKT